MKIFPFLLLGSAAFLCFSESKKTKKNQKLRNLKNSLTERIESDDGKNEYSRLTQAPIIEMKLHKTKFETSLQEILVQNYAEQAKEKIAMTNFEIGKEKALLENITNSLKNTDVMENIILEHKNVNVNNPFRNKYFNFIKSYGEPYMFPVYKMSKSNPSHFSNNIHSSLLPSEQLLKLIMTQQEFVRYLHKKPVFYERGDVM